MDGDRLRLAADKLSRSFCVAALGVLVSWGAFGIY